MFFIPLSQIESADLVVHALRAAGGEADCSTCPARRVCMKQCLTIADSIAAMISSGTLPRIAQETEPSPPPGGAGEKGAAEKDDAPKSHLKIIK